MSVLITARLERVYEYCAIAAFQKKSFERLVCHATKTR